MFGGLSSLKIVEEIGEAQAVNLFRRLSSDHFVEKVEDLDDVSFSLSLNSACTDSNVSENII